MEEELRFAVELLGRRSADYGWLIPIRLSDCKIPALPLHDGRTLRDIQWVDLFDDWNRGLVRLVETIRPLWLVDADRSIRRTRLEHGCNLHIDSKIRHFTKTGALRIQQIEERWLGLLRGEHMALFLDAAINLFDRATSANVTMTEQILEPGDTGRLILITAASAFDERTILHSLREQNPSWGCYMDFIKERRRSIRGLPNWKARDLVHWIFRQESPRGEMEIDLLYLCGHTVMLDALAFQLYLAEQEGAPQSPIEQVYPTTLMTTLDISQLVEEVLREEAALSG